VCSANVAIEVYAHPHPPTVSRATDSGNGNCHGFKGSATRVRGPTGDSGDQSLMVSSQLPVAKFALVIRFQSTAYTSCVCSSHDISGKPGLWSRHGAISQGR
jgi:hypothetical protein